MAGNYVPIQQVVLNAINNIEKASKLKGSVTGIPTGFIDLDYKTSGMHPSDLVLIAARPSMGKTAFVLNIAQYMAFRKDVTVAIFSLEMSKEQLVNRLLAMESHVDSQNMRTGNLKDEDWTKLVEGADIIGRSNLIIDDTPGISIAEMRSKCRKYKLEHNLGIIMIDYLQLMSGSGKSDSRQQEISDISRSLKALARELSVYRSLHCRSLVVRLNRDRITDRCFRIFESLVRLSRMPMSLCFCIAMIIITKIQRRKILQK